MRKVLILICGLALIASMAGAVIAGSAHDFSGETWSLNNSGTVSICIACHAPHNNLNAPAELLWNHTTSAATYTFYSSPSLDADPAVAIGAESKVCMSCHDGTVNVDAFGGSAGTTTIAANANFGTDLSNDHPISIQYCDAGTVACTTTDAELNDSATTAYGGAVIDTYLYSNRLECASCHDVHNGGAADAVGESLLYESNVSSGICLKCHGK
jgi:hypothetical protein